MARRDPPLIDAFLPAADVATRHRITVAAPPDAVYRAGRALDLGASRGIRLLFALRGMPREDLTLDGMRRMGFEILAERPGREIVLGLIGRFWTLRGDVQPIDAERFLAFAEPGFARAAWSFSVEPEGDAGSILTTETRVACTDEAGRRRFGRYWRVVGPFSGWIRNRALELIRAEAERAAG